MRLPCVGRGFVARHETTVRSSLPGYRRRGWRVRCAASVGAVVASSVPCGDLEDGRVAWTEPPGQGERKPCPEVKRPRYNRGDRTLTQVEAVLSRQAVLGMRLQPLRQVAGYVDDGDG